MSSKGFFSLFRLAVACGFYEFSFTPFFLLLPYKRINYLWWKRRAGNKIGFNNPPAKYDALSKLIIRIFFTIAKFFLVEISFVLFLRAIKNICGNFFSFWTVKKIFLTLANSVKIQPASFECRVRLQTQNNYISPSTLRMFEKNIIFSFSHGKCSLSRFSLSDGKLRRNSSGNCLGIFTWDELFDFILSVFFTLIEDFFLFWEHTALYLTNEIGRQSCLIFISVTW